MQDKIRDGTDNRGEKNLNAKITEDTAKKIKGYKGSHVECAKKLDVPYTTVQQIRKGISWKHVEIDSE
jgi:hypothetical protein